MQALVLAQFLTTPLPGGSLRVQVYGSPGPGCQPTAGHCVGANWFLFFSTPGWREMVNMLEKKTAIFEGFPQAGSMG